MTHPKPPLAILGATSALAQDYILGRSERSAEPLRLYARRPEAAQAFLAAHGLEDRHTSQPLAAFADAEHGGVLNFVGVGNPARAQAMGAGIFEATSMSDDLALDHVRRRPDAPYVFLSSGAAFGAVYDRPVDDRSCASFRLATLGPQDFYGIAKLHAEARHRGLAGATVIDVRVFNYVSRNMDPNARFLLAEMVGALRENRVFRTSATPLTRDFIHPSDLGKLIDLAVGAEPGTNMAVDAHSSMPITKAELIALMIDQFGLRVEMDAGLATTDPTGFKANYYSLSRKSALLGYDPIYSSATGIIEEIRAIIQAP